MPLGSHTNLNPKKPKLVESNMNEALKNIDQNDANRDPLSGEPGAHPMGTGVGAASAGAVATVVGGVVGGPVGAVVGAVIGSVVGGLAGKDTAEQLNPSFEDNHWRENYISRPYIEENTIYEDYQPAYRTGYEGYDRYAHSGRTYSEIETDLRRDYEANQTSDLPWEKARHAVKDAWDRAAASFKH